MNAASVLHARIHGRAIVFCARVMPELEWLIDLDFQQLTEEGMILVRPDIAGFSSDDRCQVVIEVSKTTRNQDPGLKKDFYARAQIPDYIVLDCVEKKAIIFKLYETSQYHAVPASGNFSAIETIFASKA
ncbi:MAG: Uma2 family endonuclease [Pseudobdellovibrionaceae bacterium]|nr:Uma2 family endonuclease [Pseudobdellovibrionaceae bacterium]